MNWLGLEEEISPKDDYDAGDRLAREQADEMQRRGFGDEWMYEDELPADLNDEEYDRWYQQSWVDFVRMGPYLTRCPCHDNPVRVCSGRIYCPDSDTFFRRCDGLDI